ncbi:GAP family protein [Nonomuraea longicatena]|uniref:GAP family protein n=1 Tax=Nonomuraea longicatena TaxID=83682 RepID=A0ABP3Z714_9ACTN
MDLALLLTLGALALWDSTSFGTLGIPLVLMLSSDRRQGGRLVVYLTTISVFYFLVGVALMMGLSVVMERFGAALESQPAYWVQLVLGVFLFALSWKFDSKKQKKPWEPKVGGPLTMMGVALTAGLVEVATMFPYLAAVGLMTTAGLGAAQWLPLLAGYVVLMVVPMLVLMAGRALAGPRIEGMLERVRAFITRNAASAVGWTLAIVGFLIARDALVKLDFFRDLVAGG